MILAPSAIWRGPIPNESNGFVHPSRGLVLHVEEGSESGTDSWFHNPSAQASADFGVAKDGTLHQWVDCVGTTNKAWAEAQYNPYFYSVETEGVNTEALTDAQVETVARLFWFLSEQDHFPLVITDDPNGKGLITHGDLGAAGGGHPDCPGDLRKAQRARIVTRAQQLAAPPIVIDTTKETEMITLTDPRTKEVHLVDLDGAVYDFTALGAPGGFRLGALNTHPDWHAGEGQANGPVVGAWLVEDNISSQTGGRLGLVILTRDGTGTFHPYQFPSDGSLK